MKKTIFLLGSFLIIIFRIFYINIYEKDKYQALLVNKTEKYVYGSSAPRGRILDRNGKVLVDNVGVKSLYYVKSKNVNNQDEIEIAEYLASILDIDITNNINILKKYYLVCNDNGSSLITDEEKELYSKRKISSEDIEKIKYERITDSMLDSVNKKSAIIYNLMNKGYSYEKKVNIK